jgi:hypothetical protein
MKKQLLFLSFLYFSMIAFAQDEEAIKRLEGKAKVDKGAVKDDANKLEADTTHAWKWGVVSSLNFSQTQLDNWVAGGDNNMTLNAVLGAFAGYTKDKHLLFFMLDGSYGLNRVRDLPVRKVQDYLEFNSKYAYRFSGKWSFTGFGEAISQFTNGFIYTDTSKTKNTSFFAPAYLMEGLGVAYEDPENGLSARFAPLTARQIVVLDSDVDETAFGVDAGKKVKSQVGASLRIGYNKIFWEKRASFESRLLMFSDYQNNPQNLVVNWRNKIDVKLWKALSMNFLLHMIYDPNVKFAETRTTNGVTEVVNIPKLQLLQIFGVGLGYKFTNVK